MPGTNNPITPSEMLEQALIRDELPSHVQNTETGRDGYKLGVLAERARVAEEAKPKGSHIYTGRAVGKDSTGYYNPRWDKAQPIQVQADTREEAYDKMVVALGPHPQFAIPRISGKLGYSGWIVNWDKIEVAQ